MTTESANNLFVQALQDVGTTTRTENGDITFSSSLDRCVDLFFQVGAIRADAKAKPERAQQLFAAAYGEDPALAVMIALWARDIRGGAGERQTFRNILQYIEKYNPDLLLKMLPKIPEVGRWDDLFCIMNTSKTAFAVLGMYGLALQDKHGLACKWAPREDKDPLLAARIRNYLKLSPKQYRQLIVAGTKVVEQQMCAKEWSEINYEHVPSVASARYGKAFKKHDEERYNAYLDSVRKGEKKINTSAVYPYDVIKRGVDDKVADTMWQKLPDFVKPGIGFIPMVDLSGSMSSLVAPGGPSAMDVATSLGLYLAERNKSVFKNMLLAFSANAHIIQIPEADIRTKVRELHKHAEVANTDLDAAFNLILQIAVGRKIPQSDMPNALMIISDMEFDSGTSAGYDYKTRSYVNTWNTSVFERTQANFKAAGYEMPMIIWWNVMSRHGSTPVRFNEKGTALVSGFSPSLMKNICAGQFTPREIMLSVVNQDRYRIPA